MQVIKKKYIPDYGSNVMRELKRAQGFRILGRLKL